MDTDFSGANVYGSKLFTQATADLCKSHIGASLMGVGPDFLGLVTPGNRDRLALDVDVVFGTILDRHFLDPIPELR
jgi:hypothetical protein